MEATDHGITPEAGIGMINYLKVCCCSAYIHFKNGKLFKLMNLGIFQIS